MSRRSLTSQVMLPQVLATVCLAIVLLLWLPSQIKNSVQERAYLEAAASANAIALAIRVALLEEDFETLAELAAQLESHPLFSMSAIFVRSPEGESLLAEFPIGVEFSKQTKSHPGRFAIFKTAFDGDSLEGDVRIAMDNDALDELVFDFFLPIYLAFCGLSLVLLFTARSIRNDVLQPILDLAELAKGLISRTDISALATYKKDDEIADLQQALMDLSYGLVAVEAENENILGSLEDLVEVKTRELADAESRLDRVQRIEMLAGLTGGIAHDFNNLMMVVDGCLRSLREAVEPGSEAFHTIDEAKVAVRTGVALNRRLLEFAEESSGEVSRIACAPFFMRYVRSFRSLTSFPVKVELARGVELYALNANQTAFQNVLSELVLNACDAVESLSLFQRQVGFSVEMESLDEEAFIIIKVSDNGVGMSPERRRVCLDPFFSTKGLGAGRGLGLHQVQSFVQLMGGSIDVESEEGLGTTVNLRLPVSRRVVSIGATEVSTKTSVLVVDDDARSLRTLSRTVEELGLRAIECNSGGDALSRFASVRHDLLGVISDVVMPSGVDGFRLKRELEKLMPGLRFVLISGFDFGTAAGSVEVLRKPVDSRKLKAGLFAGCSEVDATS